MVRRETVLWIRALSGSGSAYGKLGRIYIRGEEDKKQLAKLCLEKAMELGDESSFFLYHSYFSEGRKIIDNGSYRAILKDYKNTADLKEKIRLKKYLDLGT